MSEYSLLIVESDIVVRGPLAAYLRECGYEVIETANAAEARVILSESGRTIDIVLADIDAPGENGFTLAAWIRENHPDVEVILAGTVARAAEKAGELCNEGPALSKPYEHQFVLDRIRRSLAARDARRKPKE
jgi:DNA-binding NtrC family response regulator